jgi:phenylacetate-CoA ligase
MISLYDSPKKITDTLRQYNPDVIYSFPSIFKTISRFLDNGLKLNPRLIFTHGETLTASSRENIRSTFNADVYNTYGSTEFNRLAFECSEHSGYHMITDCAIIEIVKDGQCVSPGEEGEIIITGLYNEAMPFIRYKLGDIGIMADYDCACGRGWPLIKSIEGRSDDFITLPSGKRISARIINVIEDVPGIIQYRTIQEKRDKFVVQVVAGKDFTSDSERQIGEKIRSGCFGEYVNVDVELVDELQRERTGKLRAIVSNV